MKYILWLSMALLVTLALAACVPPGEVLPTAPGSTAATPASQPHLPEKIDTPVEVPAESTLTPSDSLVPVGLTWEQTEKGVCHRLSVAADSAEYGPCAGPAQQGGLSRERAAEFQQLVGMYSSVQAETPAGEVDFQGKGKIKATEAEQRSIAEWARLVYQELESGRSRAGLGLALTWTRSGGIVGFCDDLEMYVSGWATAGSCKDGQSQPPGSYRLSAEELEQLYAWSDRYESFEYRQEDPPGAADALSIVLVFTGAGTETPTTAEQEEIAQYAQEVYTSARQ